VVIHLLYYPSLMKPITEYQDYRAYIQDYYDENKRRFSLTWAKMAKKAGFAAPSYLKLVSQGKSKLSETGIAQTANALDLQGPEAEYFRELVHYNQAKTSGEKDKAYNKMAVLSRYNQAKVLQDDLLAYYNSWVNVVVRELAPEAPANLRTSNIARQIIPQVTAAEVGASLRCLEALGLLAHNEDGTYRQVDKTLTTGNSNLTSMAVRNFHKKMLDLAKDSLDNVPMEERNTANLVVGVTQEQYQQIVNEVNEFRRRIMAIASSSNEMDRVYSLQMNLFPLSHKIERDKSE